MSRRAAGRRTRSAEYRTHGLAQPHGARDPYRRRHGVRPLEPAGRALVAGHRAGRARRHAGRGRWNRRHLGCARADVGSVFPMGGGLATLLTGAAIWSLAARRWRALAILCCGAGVAAIAFATATNVFPTCFPGTDRIPLPAIVSRAIVEHVFVVAVWDPTSERTPVLGGVPV